MLAKVCKTLSGSNKTLIYFKPTICLFKYGRISRCHSHPIFIVTIHRIYCCRCVVPIQMMVEDFQINDFWNVPKSTAPITNGWNKGTLLDICIELVILFMISDWQESLQVDIDDWHWICWQWVLILHHKKAGRSERKVQLNASIYSHDVCCY